MDEEDDEDEGRGVQEAGGGTARRVILRGQQREQEPPLERELGMMRGDGELAYGSSPEAIGPFEMDG